MKFSINTLNDNGSGMKYNTKEEFLHELSIMIDDCIANGGTSFNIDVDSDASCFYDGTTSQSDYPNIIDLLDKDSVVVGNIATLDITIPSDVPDNLPSAEEFREKSEEAAINYINKKFRKYSDPVYRCPKCQEGGMCRDEEITLLSNPPKYKYICNKCKYIDFMSI